MAKKTSVYTNPQPGRPLITTISTGCRTPILPIKFSNLINAYYYPNSPTIARYSVTCLVDPNLHKEFLKGIHTVEKNEGVNTIIKNDLIKENGVFVTSGNVNLKFQTKEKIPVYVKKSNEPDDEAELLQLEDELAAGENVIVVYDILRYTKKGTAETEHGISFKPTAIYYYPQGQ